MSRITLAPNASGTGTLTLAAPNTNTDRTLTLPDATTTLVGTDATQTLTNKSIAASQLTGALPALDGSALTGLPVPAKLSTATGSAPSYSCRAWVNYDGTSGAVRASANVTSVSRTATGNCTVNITTAMTTADYSVLATCDSVSSTPNILSLTTTSFAINTRYATSNTSQDKTIVTAAIFC